jgi:hypothetical protein
VVARRADEREASALHRVDRAAGGEQRGFPARLGGDRVRVEERRRVDCLEPVEVRGLVTAFYLFTRGGPALDDVELGQEGLEPLAVLGVRLRGMKPR